MITIHFPIIDSTNDWAKRNLDDLKHNTLSLITADSQTAGRGRFSRVWHSPAGQNILATFVYFREEMEIDQTHLVQMLAKIVQEVLSENGITATIKWPNDLLVNGKKIAGILVEVLPYEQKNAIVMGLGLNVNMPQDAFDKIDQLATSMLVETGSVRLLSKVLESITNKLQEKIS